MQAWDLILARARVAGIRSRSGLKPGVARRLFCDTNPRSGVAWWCNNMAVFATLANVGWGQIVRAQGEGGKVIGVAAAS